MAVPWIGYFMLEQSLLRELIKEAKSGDVAAFERIIIVHERMVLRVTQRFLLIGKTRKMRRRRYSSASIAT